MRRLEWRRVIADIPPPIFSCSSLRLRSLAFWRSARGPEPKLGLGFTPRPGASMGPSRMVGSGKIPHAKHARRQNLSFLGALRGLGVRLSGNSFRQNSFKIHRAGRARRSARAVPRAGKWLVSPVAGSLSGARGATMPYQTASVFRCTTGARGTPSTLPEDTRAGQGFGWFLRFRASWVSTSTRCSS